MQITVIAAGPAGHALAPALLSQAPSGSRLTVLASTLADATDHGLRVCPDVDALVRALATEKESAAGTAAGTSTAAVDELARLSGVTPLPRDDAQLAAAVHRSHLLGTGRTLSDATADACRAAQVPQEVTVLPLTDDPVETHVVLDPDEPVAHQVRGWVPDGGRPDLVRVTSAGLDRATPAPGVLDAVRTADLVVLPGDDLLLSTGLVLGLPGIRDALRGTSARVVAVLPVSGDEPVPTGDAATDSRARATAALLPTPRARAAASVLADVADVLVVDPSDAGLRLPGTARTTITPAPTSLATTPSTALAACICARN